MKKYKVITKDIYTYEITIEAENEEEIRKINDRDDVLIDASTDFKQIEDKMEIVSITEIKENPISDEPEDQQGYDSDVDKIGQGI